MKKKAFTPAELQGIINKAEGDIAFAKEELKKQQEYTKVSRNKLISDSPVGKFADQLHGKMCTWNHTDGCGWFYEFVGKEHDWSGNTHARYLTKAKNIFSRLENGIKVDTSNIFEVLDLLNKG